MIDHLLFEIMPGATRAALGEPIVASLRKDPAALEDGSQKHAQ